MVNPGDLVGRQVGRYAVVSHLASGGMAELYIARQQSVGGFEKQVVLKILQPRYAKNPRVVTMFLDEGRIVSRLRHPNIVQTFETGSEQGQAFIAMELLSGQSLHAVWDACRARAACATAPTMECGRDSAAASSAGRSPRR